MLNCLLLPSSSLKLYSFFSPSPLPTFSLLPCEYLLVPIFLSSDSLSAAYSVMFSIEEYCISQFWNFHLVLFYSFHFSAEIPHLFIHFNNLFKFKHIHIAILWFLVQRLTSMCSLNL